MAKNPPIITEEEMQQVKQYILFPIILEVLERDIKLMSNTELKMGEVYVLMLRKAQNAITEDMSNLKKKLSKSGIKIYEQSRSPKMLSAKYLCRGYNNEMNLLWELVKTEIKLKLCDYLGLDITYENLHK